MFTVPPTKYTTEITKSRYPAVTDPASIPAGDWQPGLDLTFGTVDDGGIPISQVTLGETDIGVTLLIDTTTGALTLTLLGKAREGILCHFGNETYLSGTIAFSGIGDSFAGAVDSTCLHRDGGGVFLWRGIAAGDADLNRLKE